ncbi:MAG TPA: hypothetical protein VMD30_03245 [Tepidisphaeraceae bacterium]|nr:hypothetical protein [Tepidisphaeraceae bacterium]
MSQSVSDPQALNQIRQHWSDQVRNLMSNISAWAKEEGWPVVEEEKEMRDSLGAYNLPRLSIQLSNRNEIHVDPVFHVSAGRGRVDVSAIPTLNRVRLVEDREFNGWKIVTDSNVPIRRIWEKRAFTDLVADLLA